MLIADSGRGDTMYYPQRIKTKNRAINGPGNPKQKYHTSRAGGAEDSHVAKTLHPLYLFEHY